MESVPTSSAQSPRRPREPGRAWRLTGALLLILSIGAAWHNSFSGPFVLDDAPAISENPTIRHLWPPGDVVSPPGDGQTVTGRPLLNLSFALNWTISGDAVWSYHIANLGIHACAALTLFGLLWRTWQQPGLERRFGATALPLAWVTTLIWAVHPLNTESVSYIAQRAESLAGLFYLLVLYAFIRSTRGDARAWRWQTLAVAACLAGMATKETVASAPLVVLLYDRTLVAGSFRGAFRTRGWFYAALALTWLLLGWLVYGAGTRGDTAGFGLGVTSWTYLLTQCRAVTHYLRLAVWPGPLVLNYGFQIEPSALAVLPLAVVVLTLVVATMVALWKKAPIGIAGAWFFAILAPSSSVIPVVTQTMAEHRMYLPLAAVVAVCTSAAYLLLGRRAIFPGLIIAAVLGTMTVRRNEDYRNELALWRDTVAKCPQSSRSYGELGNALNRSGQTREAIAAYETALHLNPDNARAHYNLATVLLESGQPQEALHHFAIAARELPQLAAPRYGLGNALVRLGRPREAIPHYEQALRLDPTLTGAHNNLGNVLELAGRPTEAIAQFELAIKQDPAAVDPHFNLANLLSRLGRWEEAIAQYEAALRIAPDYANAHVNLGNALIHIGRLQDGIRELKRALQLDPGNAAIRGDLERIGSTMEPAQR